MRLSEEEFAALVGRPREKKRSKYRAKMTTVDGIKFPSQLEADYYSRCKLLVRLGELCGFCRQARFVVTEGADGGSATEYVCDFVLFFPDGTYRIVDTKGVKTDVFRLKIKALREKYPNIKIHCEGEIK